RVPRGPARLQGRRRHTPLLPRRVLCYTTAHAPDEKVDQEPQQGEEGGAEAEAGPPQQGSPPRNARPLGPADVDSAPALFRGPVSGTRTKFASAILRRRDFRACPRNCITLPSSGRRRAAGG